MKLPYFTQWVRDKLGADFTARPANSEMEPLVYPSPQLSPQLMEYLTRSTLDYSISGPDRLFRSHGHTLHDIYALRNGTWERIPDLVLFPTSHQQVVELIQAVNTIVKESGGDTKILLIPFGGGTSVTGALDLSLVPTTTTAVSVDLSQMVNYLFTGLLSKF